MIEHFQSLRQYIVSIYSVHVEIEELPSGIIYLNVFANDKGVELVYDPKHGFGLDIIDEDTIPFTGYTHTYRLFEEARTCAVRLIEEIL